MLQINVYKTCEDLINHTHLNIMEYKHIITIHTDNTRNNLEKGVKF